MRTWVIRHAEALHAAGMNDHERPLTANGRFQARALGRALARRASATLILSSPILRARQTAEAIREFLPDVEWRTDDAFSTSGSTREAIDRLQTLRTPECIVISHEPLTSRLVAHLANGEDAPLVQFTPATAILLDLGDQVRPGAARMMECLSPESLRHTPEL